MSKKTIVYMYYHKDRLYGWSTNKKLSTNFELQRNMEVIKSLEKKMSIEELNAIKIAYKDNELIEIPLDTSSNSYTMIIGTYLEDQKLNHEYEKFLIEISNISKMLDRLYISEDNDTFIKYCRELITCNYLEKDTTSNKLHNQFTGDMVKMFFNLFKDTF